MQTELKGQIEKISYFNDETHYTIARMRVDGRRASVTIVGNMMPLAAGEMLRVQGSWDRHPKYGEQFRITSYETVIPVTEEGIEKYLGSGLIKGIGPVMAGRLVSKFGGATIDVIENHAERLSEVGGIGEKRIKMIKTAWDAQKDVRDIMLFLQSHDVSSSYAAKIYRHYGKGSIHVVRENPYRLADDIFGIGFLTADKIAGKLGMPKESLVRAEAGILYTLRKMADEGHVYYPYEILLEKCEEILSIGNRELIEKGVGGLAAEKKVVIENVSDSDIDTDSKAVFLAEFHAAETGIAASISELIGSPKQIIGLNHDDAIKRSETELRISLANNQALAVKEALSRKFMVITGGPGTGKTTIVKAIIQLYRQCGMRVVLAAPTGRAAKRMTEATRHEAKTIHRLLEFSPKLGRFRRNHDEPLDTDLVIIDEASMVDTVLMHHLLKAVPVRATVILVGDVDQLPSVGAGNVLRDIIGSGAVAVVRLSEIFRQSRESMIVYNAHRINKGEFPVISSQGEGNSDFFFVELEEPEKVSQMILNICTNRIPEKFGLHPVNDIQVLTPMHRGAAGTSVLNAQLQEQLNPSRDEITKGGRVFRNGDKVMQIRNNYDRDVYNGDIGRISSIDREEHVLTVNYDGRSVSYDFTDLDEIVLAYAISVHKSQGSEYPAVVMPLLTQHYLLLQRNLLYTAITRGKRLIVIIGTKKALGIAIRNNKPGMRYTRLLSRLRYGL